MTEFEDAVAVLQEVMQQDLEQCGSAIRAANPGEATRALEAALAKLGGLTDMLRSAGRSAGEDWS